jgi:hypothetical protein
LGRIFKIKKYFENIEFGVSTQDLSDDELINKRLVEICDLIQNDIYIPSLGLN